MSITDNSKSPVRSLRAKRLATRSVAYCLAAAVVLALIPFWPVDNSLTVVNATLRPATMQEQAGGKGNAVADVVFDYHPSSIMGWIFGPQWDDSDEFFAFSYKPTQLGKDKFPFGSASSLSEKSMIRAHVIRCWRRYQYSLSDFQSGPFYISEGINGEKKVAVLLPIENVAGEPSMPSAAGVLEGPNHKPAQYDVTVVTETITK